MSEAANATSAALPAGPPVAPRLALYWAPPPTHPLWRSGCDWLGRDPAGTDLGAPPAHARAPWRYGFHATLKAPMHPRHGADEAAFIDAVAAFSARWHDFEMPPLRVAWLRGFMALRPTHALCAVHPLRRLADACVTEFDPWRAHAAHAPPWGYAHVFERWRFHMTLSDDTPNDRTRLEARASAHFAPSLAVPLRAQGLAVFREDQPGAPLRLLGRFDFAR